MEELAEESRYCLDSDSIEALRECSLSGEGVVEVNVGGLRYRIPCWHLPEAWANLLHVTCSRDYEKLPGFTPHKGWVVMDAGAYIGFYTVYAALRVGREGLVVAIEPLGVNRAFLEENIVVNGFEDRVRVDPRALSDKRSVALLHVSCYPATSSLFQDHILRHGEVCGSKRVVTVPLDQLIQDHGLERVDLLKLDIEGAERLVLGSRGWDRYVERLVVEVHTDVVEVAEIIKLLEERGYRVRQYKIGDFQHVVYAW